MNKIWWIVIVIFAIAAIVMGIYNYLTFGVFLEPERAPVGYSNFEYCTEDEDCSGDAECIDNRCSCESLLMTPNYCVREGCVNFGNDPFNCGSCNERCPGIRDGAQCINGECGCEDEGETYCGNGGCVDTLKDPFNCGGCAGDGGEVCGGNQICTDGECDCPDGLTECNGECVDIVNDPDNCGACGEECSDNVICEEGECTICMDGYESCDGICRDLKIDEDHCGECFNSCDEGEICFLGACHPDDI